MPLLTLDPIATVHNAVRERADTGWGAVESRIVLAAPYHGMLAGLEEFSHVLVVFWMQGAGTDPSHWTTATGLAPRRHPRDNTALPLRGLLAQRARERPNPLGVTVCECVRVEPTTLTVRGLDAIDGTPVLDLKPHVPAFDAPRGAVTAAWMDGIMAEYFTKPV